MELTREEIKLMFPQIGRGQEFKNGMFLKYSNTYNGYNAV